MNAASAGLRAALLVLLAVSAIPATQSLAAAPVQPIGGIEAQRQALLNRMLADPGNVEIAVAYAELSSKAGDLEGAISTLERLLIFSPNLARLNFELGVLYFRLGAYDMASAYFKTAGEAPDATAELRGQIAAYLAQGDIRNASDRTLGSLMFGARYQTNANGGAGSPWIDLNGIPFQLNPAAQADPDANGFVSGNLHFSHDLAAQGDRLDTDVAVYGSLYGKHDELDTVAAEVQSGPVFNLERFDIDHSTLQLYGILSGVVLRGDPYLLTVGAGSVLTSDLDPETRARARLEYRYETFFNSDLRPSVSDMTGPRIRLLGDIRHQLSDRLSVYGSIYGERKNAVAGLDADWEAGAAIGTTLQFNGPFLNRIRPWSLDISAGVLQRQFDAPDPVISTAARSDREAFVQGALTIPVADTWSAVATLGYRKALSNYDLYTYDNVSTSLAMMKSF